MLSGHNFIGFNKGAAGSKTIRSFSTILNDHLPEEFFVATPGEIETALERSTQAFKIYRNTTPSQRADFLEAIAEEIIELGEILIVRAMQETGLPEARLQGERMRTINQAKLFASVLREGSYVEAVIDTALPERSPLPRPDIRKMLVPLGPVLVFGASNFPFAFSTAGGDTISALAAGCPVIVKAHNAHLGTNELMASAIIAAAERTSMPDGVFSSLIGEGNEIGQMLAKDNNIKAIGFTGSHQAGMSIYKAATQERKQPIPVFAEMSSVNPVVLLPGKLSTDALSIASQLAGSVLLGAGQFCTNPGIIFVLAGTSADLFTQALINELNAAQQTSMLTPAICRSYYSERERLSSRPGVNLLFKGKDKSDSYKGSATLMEVSAMNFIKNTELQDEVFGPSSLIVKANDAGELLHAIEVLNGQLTGTVFGNETDIAGFRNCLEFLEEKVGRMIFNNVPTGVEVCHAMVHGGPYPATSDGRSTSVGADAIKRFLRPICFQNAEPGILPEQLKDENPYGIMRKINGEFRR
jgi:2,5-dioxopentanoate dehydrogenase